MREVTVLQFEGKGFLLNLLSPKFLETLAIVNAKAVREKVRSLPNLASYEYTSFFSFVAPGFHRKKSTQNESNDIFC